VTLRAGGTDAWSIPELGPYLGRLSDPPAITHRDPRMIPLDDIRIRMVTGVFELAGAARSFAGAGDPQGAMASLSRLAWLGLWEKAVAGSAERISAAVNTGFHAAARESRFAAHRLKRLLLTPDDTRAIAARLGSGGAPFVAALDLLEQTVHSASSRSHPQPGEWQAALTAAARRLESAWLSLEQSAAVELQRWQGEIERVRAWSRPRWPLWLFTIAVLTGAIYLGLVLGGYLPVPEALRGLARFWWTRW
jgi:hypothetical protein